MEEVGRRPPGSFLRMVKKPRKTLPRVSPVSCKGTELAPPSALLAQGRGAEVPTQNLALGTGRAKAQSSVFPALPKELCLYLNA